MIKKSNILALTALLVASAGARAVMTTSGKHAVDQTGRVLHPGIDEHCKETGRLPEEYPIPGGKSTLHHKN